MIKVFNKLRQRLLLQGRIGRYLAYAIGEIVLVVIGILIALQINNWNGARLQGLAEKEFLQGVKNDLVLDMDYIDLVTDLIDPRVQSFERIQSEIGEPDFGLDDLPFVDSLLGIYFSPQRTFYPVSGSYESAVSGNEINKFKNKELIKKITKLYNSTYPRLIDNGNILDQRWDYLTRNYTRQRRTGNFDLSENNEALVVVDDVFYHYIQLKWYRDNLRDALKEIEELIRSIP